MGSYSIGPKCPYCMTEIAEADESVVCSACHMPHHKDCWTENQGCTTFGCQGTIEAQDYIFCSRCGLKSSTEHSFCQRCGNRLIHRPGAAQDFPGTQSSSAYTQGSSAHTQGSSAHTQSSSAYTQGSYTYTQGYTPYAHSGFAAQSADGGFEENLFIGSEATYYQAKFKDMRATHHKTSWNWAAFFLSTYWCFYRKMYKAGGLVLGANVLCVLFGPLSTYLSLGISVVVGFWGNSFYMQHVTDEMGKYAYLPEEQRRTVYIQKGGTNVGAALAAAGGVVLLIILLALSWL